MISCCALPAGQNKDWAAGRRLRTHRREQGSAPSVGDTHVCGGPGRISCKKQYLSPPDENPMLGKPSLSFWLCNGIWRASLEASSSLQGPLLGERRVRDRECTCCRWNIKMHLPQFLPLFPHVLSTYFLHFYVFRDCNAEFRVT